MERKLFITGDGSPSIFVPELDETYHSRHGAIRESMHVYIDQGLRQFSNRSQITILEVGLGTGLNALLTWMHKGGLRVKYTALEPYPLSETEWNSIHFYPDHNKVFQHIHSSSFSLEIDLDSDFTFRKERTKIQDFQTNILYDLVYYDAFAPAKQSNMWTPEIFSALHGLMNHGGLLTTYCASGEVRRMMKSAGFEVQKLMGPPGKKEMLVGRKRDANT